MILNSPYITGSITVTGNANIQGQLTVTGSLSGTATSASYAYTASSAINAFSASNAISSSYSATASFSNDFTVLGNLTVFGTQSVQYITSSQLNISDNVITVNVASPGVRFGGLSVFDSGSQSSEATASLFWDSQNNHWVYQRESGSTYNGGMLISGPRNAGGLGNETGTTACMLLVGQGGDHLTSSMIYHSTTCTNFYSNALFVSSSGNVGIGTCNPSGIFQAGVANSGIYFDTSLQYTPKIIAAGTISDIQIQSVGNGGNVYLNAPGTTSLIGLSVNGCERMRITSAGKVYIGTTCFCWTDSTFKTIQVGNGAFNNTSNQTQIVNNIYYDDTNYRNLIAGAANRIIMNTAGDFSFEYACAATAGSALTLASRFFICGINGSAVVCSTAALTIPVGTTAQRPSPTQGMIRMNSTTGQPEWYDSISSSWVSFASQIGTCTYDVQYLVVGGGGGGGFDRGGAGGAGGYRLSCTTLVSGISYYAIIGAGGAGSVFGIQGGRSSFNTIASIGGGAGGSGNNEYAGTDGGSGGGGGNSAGGFSNTGGAGTTGQGNAGGNGVYAAPNYGAGGGGGAGAVGANGTSTVSGNGGVGCSNSICGVTRFYAGGGGAGNYGGGVNGDGGNGGGGNGVYSGTACSGTANSGGGGGSVGTGGTGGSGGSGIVIIRYCGSQRGTGGTVVSCNGHTIHIFSSSTMYSA